MELYKAGMVQEAATSLEEARDLRRDSCGAQCKEYATAATSLAQVLMGWGRCGKAELLFEESRQIKFECWGSNHPNYALTLNGMAELYMSMGANQKAEELLEESVG